MKAKDLDLLQILDIRKDEGMISIGDERVLIMDTASLGILRKELIDLVGMEAAKRVFLRFGYAQGWRNAEVFKDIIPWDSKKEWIKAGRILHQLLGVVKVELSGEETKDYFQGNWINSYEANEHIAQFGISKDPVCWSLVGFAGGYISHVLNKRIIFDEVKCVAKGDDVCHVVGRPAEDWGDRSCSLQTQYSHESLYKILGKVASKLRETEKNLAKKRDILKSDDDDFFARSESMLKIANTSKHIAGYDSTVLILGESGAGKEYLAKYIHNNSKRSDKPFVAVNCGAFAETLLESELFGHIKGSFTGAESDRPGTFEQADGGTLFLDEVGEMSNKTQVMLLRVLQEREVQRLGDTKYRKVNIRIIAATNKNLVDLLNEKTFREDLYYRLRVVEINIPPLRERKEEIIPLSIKFVNSFSKRYDKSISGFDPHFADYLLKQDWPGNIRELQNFLESAVVLSKEKRLTLKSVPHYSSGSNGNGFTKKTDCEVRPVNDEIKDIISNALKTMKGKSQAQIAKALDITPATLWRWRKKIDN